MLGYASFSCVKSLLKLQIDIENLILGDASKSLGLQLISYATATKFGFVTHAHILL